jgi:murein DD-endopeptidase MepM/ murein hydrolase activator NlpD
MRLAIALVLIASLSLSAFGQDTPSQTVHVVQRGENLFRISLRYGLTVEQIARANGITRPETIYVGQRLLIPSGDVTPMALQEVVHVVQPGESLSSIAAFYAVDPAALMARNGLSGDAIAVGQLLTIPAGNSIALAVTPPPQSAPPVQPPESPPQIVSDQQADDPTQTLIHIVTRGESLFTISQRYGVDVTAIVNANVFTNPSLIYPGQELIIPGVMPTRYAGVLPAPIERLTVTPLVLVEGRTGRIDFVTSTPASIPARFLDRDVPVISRNEGVLHTILIGVPLDTPAGVSPLTLMVNGEPYTVNLQINAGEYRRESLTLSADRLALINQSVDDTERALVAGVMTRSTPERFFDGLMGLPAAAPMSSPFGARRTYNGGVFSNLHTGTDFAAASGAPIIAPAAGVVVLADTLNVRGVATVIDHGWGVYTGYWHQAERYVRLGDRVQAGQVIGTVGSTGRVTGAHLHWELWVNGVAVDPMQWVSEPLGR